MNLMMENMLDSGYCVYIHKINGAVVYVGSGRKVRMRSKSGRQQNHLKFWDLIDFEIISKNMCLEDARLLEQELILKYSECNLFNKQRKIQQPLQIDYKVLSDFLYYDESSSTQLRWKVRINQGVHIGDEAGNRNTRGYVQVTLKRRRFYAHRIVYCLVNKANLQTTDIIDHIDYVKHNNLASNLQLITASENIKRSVVFNGNTLNERNIIEVVDSCRFKVTWVENLKPKILYFSYKLSDRNRGSDRNHPTRESSLKAAIEFRDSLIAKGLILIKGDVNAD